jgi:hypothetical protein
VAALSRRQERWLRAAYAHEAAQLCPPPPQPPLRRSADDAARLDPARAEAVLPYGDWRAAVVLHRLRALLRVHAALHVALLALYLAATRPGAASAVPAVELVRRLVPRALLVQAPASAALAAVLATPRGRAWAARHHSYVLAAHYALHGVAAAAACVLAQGEGGAWPHGMAVVAAATTLVHAALCSLRPAVLAPLLAARAATSFLPSLVDGQRCVFSPAGLALNVAAVAAALALALQRERRLWAAYATHAAAVAASARGKAKTA